MGGVSEDSCPRLLDLIPREREWNWRGGGENEGVKICGAEDEKKLELRLWPMNRDGREHPSVLSLGLPTRPSAGAKRGFLELQSPEDGDDGFQKQQQQQKGGFQHYQADGMVAGQQYQQNHDKKACPHAAAAPAVAAAGNTAVALSKPQSRITNTPVVGWPPVRSFRKNITSASKSPPVSQEIEPKKIDTADNSTKSLFLKINMDGIPIGRKIDLRAYKSYDALSVAVDELFRGLLAAQRECHVNNGSSANECLRITGLLDGSGEYTLVYEDSDGDRILVGDVPWEMFVSTAKRLRVLKTSQLSTSALGAVNKKRAGGIP